MINANRNLEMYAVLGVPVWPDADADFVGAPRRFSGWTNPLRSGVARDVPCDTPRSPLDLVERLSAYVSASGAAVAVTQEGGRIQRQSVFCLLHRSVAHDLRVFLDGGGRKIERWLEREGCV